MDQTPSQKFQVIKYLYFYIVSVVALFMVVFSFVDVVNITLRTFIFTKADQNSYAYYPKCPAIPTDTSTPRDYNCIPEEEQRRMDKENNIAQKQRDLVRDISFILVGAPLFVYHWRIIRKRDM